MNRLGLTLAALLVAACGSAAPEPSAAEPTATPGAVGFSVRMSVQDACDFIGGCGYSANLVGEDGRHHHLDFEYRRANDDWALPADAPSSLHPAGTR